MRDGRRPEEERQDTLAVVTAKMNSVAVKAEVEKMGQMIGQTWEEEMMERVRNEGLNTARRNLRALLEQRFGPLPAELLQRIDSAHDIERLSDCVLQVARINAPGELQL